MSTLKSPLLVICGATGTGKSDLAVSLAQRFNGEIINADAVQMYKGLPIVTNKIPYDQQRGVPHHLLDFIDLKAKTWTVRDFVWEARRIIEEIRGRGRLPVVVGGTGYYIHGLLFEGGLLNGAGDEEGVEGGGSAFVESGADSVDAEALQGTTEELYARLVQVDPEMARRWHPKDRRKIQRSLEIFMQTGRKASETYQEQKTRSPGTTPSMRYDSLILWLDAEDLTLKRRLDKRVEAMIERGLLDEVQQIRELDEEMANAGHMHDKTVGIWVALGYKELEPWLDVKDDVSVAPDVKAKALREGVEAVKAGTRRYAKRQNRYLRHRFARPIEEANASDKLFLLDTSDVDKWYENVQGPAQHILECFLAGRALPEPATLSDLAKKTFGRMDSAEDATHQRFIRHCEECDKDLMTEAEWIGHIKSRSHKKSAEWNRHQAAKKSLLTALEEKALEENSGAG